MLVEATGRVVNGVHHDDSAAGEADGVEDRCEGLGEQVPAEVLTVELLGEREPR